MEGYKIKQIMPLPENMTVLRDWRDDNGKEMTRDVDFDDFTYCLALVTRPDGYEDVIPFGINDNGLGPDYEVVPARKCPCCGKRMSAYRPVRRGLELRYYCRNCGKDLDSEHWDYHLPCEAGFGEGEDDEES
ncbi:MAG: hypothetical protein LUE24_11765 [Lachnospiraceae bacterium]|nr:hypothetical protein [Lachnospiraceae bacterium]